MIALIGTALQLLGAEPFGLGHPQRAAGRSPLWGTLRKKYLLANPRCVITGSSVDLDVHHVQPVHLFPSLELAWDNLVTLRRDVHLLVGHCGDWKLWNDDFHACAEQLAAAWRGARRT